MSSALAPLIRDSHLPGVCLRDDGLICYRREVDEWIETIVEHDVRGLVFVSGDLHLSCTAELTFEHRRSSRQVCALQIVSSALYAPLAFVNTAADDIDWEVERAVALPTTRLRYIAHFLSSHRSQFGHITARQGDGAWTVDISVYDERAEELARVSYPIET